MTRTHEIIAVPPRSNPCIVRYIGVLCSKPCSLTNHSCGVFRGSFLRPGAHTESPTQSHTTIYGAKDVEDAFLYGRHLDPVSRPQMEGHSDIIMGFEDSVCLRNEDRALECM